MKTLVLRWLIGVLFLWAAISKIGNPREFLGSVYAYELPFPRLILQGVAVVLPWLELLCGLLLVAGFWPETALFVATVLLGVFVLATGQAWARGLKIDCGCFNLDFLGPGLSSSLKFVETAAFAFFRNLGLLGLIAWGFGEGETDPKLLDFA